MSAAIIANPSITLSKSSTANEIESTYNANGARYYKNPCQEMLARAQGNDERIGGMIFVESSGKRGKFLVPDTIKVSQFLTETKEIDFSEADFAVPVTTIHVKDFLGGIRLTVPPGVRVETQAVGFLSDTKYSKALAGDNATDYNNGPLIIVKGAHILSKINVKVNSEVPPITIIH